MTNIPFETVDVPRGAYISWGTYPGQKVVGKVVDYSPSGGTDFNENPCPQLQVELIEPAKSIAKDGTITDFDAGEFVVLNAGLVSLKRAIRAADPSPGDIVKIELTSLAKAAKGEVKEFSIQIARGAGKSAAPAAAPVQAGNPFGAPAAAAAPSANPFG